MILLRTSPPSLGRLGAQGDSGVGHSSETVWLGTSGVGRFWGWALQGEEKSSGRGEELSLSSNNPTPRVGKKPSQNPHCRGPQGSVAPRGRGEMEKHGLHGSSQGLEKISTCPVPAMGSMIHGQAVAAWDC